MKFFNTKRPSSILGLALDANRLDAVVVRRAGASLLVRHSLSAALALSPLTGDPELVGREIQNHLDAAGIRERRCAVCLPLNWILTLQTKVPSELSGPDLDSFLQIEAERGFPSGYESLYITRSLFKTPSGDSYANLLAVPRNHLSLLEQVLRAAKLKPLIFSLGISATQSPGQQPNLRVLALALSAKGLELQVTGGGGIIALRSLDAAVETEGARRSVSADLVAREVRITLGQLPGGFAEAAGPIKIFGEGEMARQFVTDIAPRLTPLGLRIEPVDRPVNVTFEKTPAPDIAASPALALAAAFVNNVDVGPDFLPPKVSPWKVFVSDKLGTQKLAYAGGVAGFLLLCVGGAFGWQQYQIMDLNSQWNKISRRVAILDSDQANISTYRPWFDKSCRALAIWKSVVSAFPDSGAMTVKSLEIQNQTEVTLTGTARNNADFLAVREKLGKIPELANVHSDVRGQSPIQYEINFEWQPGSQDEGDSSNGN